MADEQAPAPEAPPAPTIEELQAQLAAEKQGREQAEANSRVYQQTLQAIQPPQQAQPPQQYQQAPSVAGQFSREQLEQFKQLTGLQDDQQAMESLRYAQAAFGVVAAPYVRGIEGLAVENDRLKARLTIDDYKAFSGEAEKIQGEYLQRGQFLSATEAYHLARSRKLPEILKQEAEKSAREQGQQAASAASSSAEAQPGAAVVTQRQVHAPVKKPMTREEFAKLSIEDKEKALENLTI